MCGIIGIISKEQVAPVILEALKRLEYRGYDSTGIATLHNGKIDRRRAEGKLSNLRQLIEKEPLVGALGIGHTRWATHGAPTSNNAHPHATDRVAVVHNGIIENFKALKEELSGKGAQFQTETDTEVIVHLFSTYLDDGMDDVTAAQNTFNRLQGAFAIGLIVNSDNGGDEEKMIVARKGSPLAIGHGEGEIYVGSDAFSLAPLTNRITYLEDNDWAVLTRKEVKIFLSDGTSVKRPQQYVDASAGLVDKGVYKHFMAKEIFEQPTVISHTFSHYIDPETESIKLPDLPFDLKNVPRVTMIGCGTAHYASMVAKGWFETIAKIPAEIDIASEFRYRHAPLDSNDLAIFVSQSGETADTLAALKYCKENNIKTLTVVNVTGSSMQREADAALPTFAGPEIGVASTKAFTCQLATLLCLAGAIGTAKGHLSKKDETALVRQMLTIPRMAGDILKLNDKIQALANAQLAKADNVIYIGRQAMFALALEGALKLKEISYIHAEGFAAGELKHGSIALVDENLPVVVLALEDMLFSKTVSNMQEVMARKGPVILLSSQKGFDEAGKGTQASLIMPDMDATIAPILYAIPLQLLAYHTAVAKGTDVDQPRNLAKSVTVE